MSMSATKRAAVCARIQSFAIVPAVADDKAIIARGYDIQWVFYNDPVGDGGRSYGCDWPTMRALYPDLCREWDCLKSEWNRRNPPMKLSR